MGAKEGKLPEMRCRRCGVVMEMTKTYFEYLGHGFHTDVLRCPECGEVFIPEELAMGKIADIERNLEDK